MSFARAAFAKTKSRWERTRRSVSSSAAWSAARALRFARMTSISFCSAICSSRISLFKRTTLMGSTKTVEPEPDSSWTMPWTWERYSAFTGTQ